MYSAARKKKVDAVKDPDKSVLLKAVGIIESKCDEIVAAERDLATAYNVSSTLMCILNIAFTLRPSSIQVPPEILSWKTPSMSYLALFRSPLENPRSRRSAICTITWRTTIRACTSPESFAKH